MRRRPRTVGSNSRPVSSRAGAHARPKTVAFASRRRMSGRGERWAPLRGRTYASQRAVARWAARNDKGNSRCFAVPRDAPRAAPAAETVAMGDYEDHDLLVARHASSRKDRHRRRKYRRDRVRPEDRDDLVAGLRQSHDAWTDVVKDRHADDDFYHDDERRSRSASASPAKRPPQRRDDDNVMVEVQRELATQLHRQEQLHASMEKLLDRQRKLAQELVERDEQSRRHVQRIEAVVSSMATGEAVPEAANAEAEPLPSSRRGDPTPLAASSLALDTPSPRRASSSNGASSFSAGGSAVPKLQPVKSTSTKSLASPRTARSW